MDRIGIVNHMRMRIFSETFEHIVLDGDVVRPVMSSHAAVIYGGKVDPGAGVDRDVVTFHRSALGNRHSVFGDMASKIEILDRHILTSSKNHRLCYRGRRGRIETHPLITLALKCEMMIRVALFMQGQVFQIIAVQKEDPHGLIFKLDLDLVP